MPRIYALLATLAMITSPLWPDPPVSPATDPPVARGFPELLSESPWFKNVPKHELAAGFRPYRVRVSGWADGAKKHRFFRLPKGKKATYREDGAWSFPEGTVFLQTLVLPLREEKRRIETRVIELGPKGLLFATYEWSEDQKAARLVTEERIKPITWEDGFMEWELTADTRCVECHNPKTQNLLGLTTLQLDLDGGEKNQIAAWDRLGLVSGVPENRKPATNALVDPFDESKPLERRARSYLATNCSPCHQPEGNGSGTMDLRLGTPMKKTGLGRRHNILRRGRPERSWIYLRMIYDTDQAMPGILTLHEDEAGSQLIHDWVVDLGG